MSTTLIGCYILALYDVCNTTEEFHLRLKETLKWIVLPEAIAKVLNKKIAYCYRTISGTCWIKYPEEPLLKEIEKDFLEYHEEAGDPLKINLKEFEVQNYGHKYFKLLKVGIIFEKIMQEKLQGVTFNKKSIKTISKILISKRIIQKSGLTFNNAWLNNVKLPLKSAYPDGIYQKIISDIMLTADENQRISDGNFSIEREAGGQSKVLERIFDELYAELYVRISQLL